MSELNNAGAKVITVSLRAGKIVLCVFFFAGLAGPAFAVRGPSVERDLASELPGEWRMTWGSGEYDAVFGADGGYFWRSRSSTTVESLGSSWQPPWNPDNGWNRRQDGSLWVREGKANFHWRLSPSPGGWAGEGWREGRPGDRFPVVLTRP